MSSPGVNPRELVAGLSGPSLISFADACAEEIILRGLPLPENFGALAIAGASSSAEDNLSAEVDSSASSETTSSTESRPTTASSSRVKLINPLLRPEAIEPSVLADGRLVITHISMGVTLDGERLKIKGKPYGTLAILGANANRVVNLDFLKQCLWPEYASDLSLVNYQMPTQNISRARKFLGDDDLGHPERGVIRNVPNVGWVALTSLGEES